MRNRLSLVPSVVQAAAAAVLIAVSTAPRVAGAQPQPKTPDEALLQAVDKATVPAAAAPEAAPRPASLPPNELKWIYSQAESRAVRATVFSAALRDAYGDVKAANGQALLVLDVELENIIPLTLIYEKQVPTEYQVPNLADHVYLVIDGVRAVRLHADADELPGHIKVTEFKLPRIGERARGNLVFDAGRMAEAKTVELRYYDYAHGHFALKLAGTDEAFAANTAAKPIQPPLKNAVVEAGVFGLNKTPDLNGQKAPEGMTFVVADLRARSMFTFEGDATAFDPKARPKSKMKIGTVADWTEAHRYLQLVVDGERAYMPLQAATTLPAAPRFLPDVFTGGQVVFLAPTDATSLELRCDFPNARTPSGSVIHPEGLVLSLEGKRPALAKRDAIVAVDDDVYKVAVVGQSTPATFAGAKPAEGHQFLVLDISVSNVGKQGELFQTKEQLKCATSDGGQLEVDPATFEGKYRPTELVFIPPGERRTFQVAYAIPGEETNPRLAYGGISVAKTLDLKPLDGAAVADARPSAPPTPAPAPTADAPQPKPQPPAAPKPQVAKATPAPAPKKADEPAAPARVSARQPHQPKGLAGVDLTPKQVNESIDRGAAFLWKYIQENDLRNNYDFGGAREHVLAALALVHAGAHKKFPEFDATVRRFIANYNVHQVNHTYEIGLYMMLIGAYGDPTFLPQLRTATQWLLDTQGPQGTWGYGFKTEAPQQGVKIRRVLQVAGGRPANEPAGGTPLVRKIPWEKGHDGDNSVTQYALLGLHAASRAQIEIPDEVWSRALATHRKRQDKQTGGWAYTTGGVGSVYGSMTAAGVCAIALARHELGEKDFAADSDIEEGLAWLSRYFTVVGNPRPTVSRENEHTDWHYYYLYSLERVGRILDTEFIGEHEWYPLGAQFLLKQQRPEDGGWTSEHDQNNDPVIATSFALLFLTRATESLDLPERTGPGTLVTSIQAPPGQKVYIILDCSGTMLEANKGTPRFEVARAAMARLAEELSPNSEVGLRVFGATKSALQEGANEDTVLLAPMNKQGREQALAALQQVRPRGKTPLTRTLIAAAGDVKGRGSEDDPVTVILVTDGGEDNTRPPKDPLEAAKELGETPGVRWYVIGFDVNRPEWTKQLDGLARSGGGQYLAAEDGEALHREMRSAVLGMPESFTIVDAQGRPVRSGQFGESVKLPEGQYKFQTRFGGYGFEEPFWINPGSTTAVTFEAAAVAEAVAAGQGTPAPATAPPAGAAPPAAAPPGTPQPGAKFCTSCGNQLTTAGKFCTHCGAAVK